jgi:hypothetical protein
VYVCALFDYVMVCVYVHCLPPDQPDCPAPVRDGVCVFTVCPQINLIAPPLYVMTTNTLEKTEGLALLAKAIAVIKDTIEADSGGVFNVQSAVSLCALW